MKKRFTL